MDNSPKARKVGDFVSVYDPKYDESYPCKIVGTSSLGGEIKMHWHGYKKAKDFWLERNSDRIADLVELPGAAGKRARDSDSEEDTNRKRLRSTQKDGSPLPDENSGINSAVEPDVRSAELLIDTLAEDLRVRSFHHPNVPDPPNDQDSFPNSLADPGTNSQVSTSRSDDVLVRDLASDQIHCKMCSGVIEGGEISCDRCKMKFHPRVMCLGVAETAVQVLSTTHDGSLNYVCCDCRVSASSPPASSPVDQGGINQLLGIVKGMLSEVNILMNEAKINRLQERNPASSHSQSRSVGTSPTDRSARKDILDGIREISEREKRKDTLVFRGFRADDAQQMTSRFREVCLYLEVGHIQLSEVVKINNSLFRAKVSNASDRLRLLAEARKLKNSDQYRRAFIQRDLTYQQRQDMKAKRAERYAATEGTLDRHSNDRDIEANPVPARARNQSTSLNRAASLEPVLPRRNGGRVHNTSRSRPRRGDLIGSRTTSRGRGDVETAARLGETSRPSASQPSAGEGGGNSRGRGGRNRGRWRGPSDRFQHQIRRNAFLE